MEENNKVIVFEKKEIILILVFVLVLIVTSFTLGIRLGKKLSVPVAPVAATEVTPTKTETAPVELKSVQEEDAEKSISENSALSDEEKLKKLMDESQSRLSNELEKFSKEDTVLPTAPAVQPTTQTAASESADSMVGKYTVQLGSYPSLEEAKQFAEGFTVRGYNPIINETRITGKGTWYRVSLGLFASVEEAKTYIKNEQSLFSGQDYVITEIK